MEAPSLTSEMGRTEPKTAAVLPITWLTTSLPRPENGVAAPTVRLPEKRRSSGMVLANDRVPVVGPPLSPLPLATLVTTLAGSQRDWALFHESACPAAGAVLNTARPWSPLALVAEATAPLILPPSMPVARLVSLTQPLHADE